MLIYKLDRFINYGLVLFKDYIYRAWQIGYRYYLNQDHTIMLCYRVPIRSDEGCIVADMILLALIDIIV